MKKLILLVSLCVCCVSFTGINIVEAQTAKTTSQIFSNEKDADLYMKNSNLHDYTPEVLYGENKLRGILFVTQDFLYKALIPVSIILTVWAGMQLIFSRGSEDTFNEKKTQFIGIFLGFAVLMLSKVVVDDIFFGIDYDNGWLGYKNIGDYFGFGDEESRQIIDAGQILNENDSTSFAKEAFRQLEGLFNYAITFSVGVAVLFVIYAAYRMVTADNDDTLSQARKQILYVLGGMVVLVSGRRLVGLFRGESRSQIGLDGLYNDGNLVVPKPSSTLDFVIDWANFALSFLGIVAIVGLIYGGIQLITALGENDDAQQTAKRIIIYSIIGLVVAISAWTIIQTFITLG
jgi:hypothetical protein